MAKKKGRKKAKRAWALVTRTQAIRAGISFGETGCGLGLTKATLAAARKKLGKKK